MNIILIEAYELTANRVVLDDYRAKHVVKVLKSRVGDTLRIGIIDGDMGEARVEAVQSKFPFVVELTVILDNLSTLQAANNGDAASMPRVERL